MKKPRTLGFFFDAVINESITPKNDFSNKYNEYQHDIIIFFRLPEKTSW